MSLQSPSSDSTGERGDSSSSGTAGALAPEVGPLLFAGVRTGDSALVLPVAVLEGNTFRALSPGVQGAQWAQDILRERLRPGARLTLFSQGVRVGTFTAGVGGGMASESCLPRPQAPGRIELVPQAVDAQRFLALEEEIGGHFPVLPYVVLQDEYAQRRASTDMAQALIPQVGATWPPSLLEARRDLQVFQLQGAPGPAVMATFLYRDGFTLDPAPDEAYSLLVLGEPRDGAYFNTFVRYRLVGSADKGAPRLFSHLDWDQDGQGEILLEVFGQGSRWWVGLDRVEEGWRIAFEDPCGPGSRDDPTNPSQP